MKLSSKIAVFLVLACVCGQSSPVFSADTESTDFNPNYLISDAEMQEWQSMNQTDVQAFLTDYGSGLANLTLLDKNGITKSTPEIIINAAQEHKINPKYILVKLQKEQSLITTANPSQKQLDGAAGYGITDGCGWDCEMYKNNQGFGKQVDSAAGIIRWYYNNKNTADWIKKAGISYLVDGTTIIPANDATAFLYTYTPHLHGNENFWKLWQNWFGYSIPDGSLVKSADSPAVYLIQDSKKRLIKSMSILISRFDKKMIMTIPASELANYPAGNDIFLPNYSILKNNDKYYLVDFDAIRPFANFEVVKKLGYNPDEFIEVTSADLAGYAIGSVIQIDTSDPLGKLVKLKTDGSVYYLKDGFYHPVYNEQIAKITFPNLSIKTVQTPELANHQPGPIVKLKDGTLFKTKGGTAIYVVEKGKKRLIATDEVFAGFGYNQENILTVDDVLAIIHETGQPVYLPGRIAAMQASTPPELDDQEIQVSDEIEENGKMVAVPEAQSQYIGKKISTNVNTYLIADYETGKILAGKNVDKVRPMASFAKVMTAYQLMFDGLLTFGSTTYDPKMNAKSSQFRAVKGEVFKNSDLLYSLLTSSINTPARMLVLGSQKDEAKFIKKMNAKAKEWGLTKTRFIDTYGYDLGNVTTAKEFLTLYTKAERNGDLRQALGAKEYSYNEIKDLDGKTKHYDTHSNMLMNKPGLPFKIISSKTGYLDEAGAGLVMLIERPSDKKQFIIITMGNPDYKNRFVEPERLANWSLTNF